MAENSWKVLSSVKIADAGFFSLRKDECRLSDGRVMPGYYVIEFSDWVNVVPLTRDNQVVLIRQYRHGAEGTFWEIPGGTTHPGQNENPLIAAKRELMEETGHAAENWTYKGYHYPNPALQNNKMHTYLATGCHLISSPQLDPYEEIEVITVTLHEVRRMLNQGEIKHSLMAASIALALVGI